MNLSEGHHIMVAHPFSYVIFCLLQFYVEKLFLLLQKMVGGLESPCSQCLPPCI